MSYREYGKNIKDKIMKNYKLLEDIVIPKGTVFVGAECSHFAKPYDAVIGDDLVDSAITVTINDDVIEEMGDKLREI